jgi:hypothetical protein
MANPLYNEFGPVPQGMPQDFMSRLNMLKQSVSDPNAMIQQMLNSGRISQAQYDSAVKQAQQIQAMINHQNGS